MSPMIFLLLWKLNDKSEDVSTNIEFQMLFFTAVQLFPFTHIKYFKQTKKILGWIKLLTFEPRSLKIISTSKILPNCCKEIENLHEKKITSMLYHIKYKCLFQKLMHHITKLKNIKWKTVKHQKRHTEE